MTGIRVFEGLGYTLVLYAVMGIYYISVMIEIHNREVEEYKRKMLETWK